MDNLDFVHAICDADAAAAAVAWVAIVGRGGGNIARAQEDIVAKRPLRSPAVVRGTVGGEAHDGYVVQARAGQEIMVRIA